MEEKKSTSVLNALDECVAEYIAEKRSGIDCFVAKHFSLRETVAIQKKYFLIDLVANPLNAIWAIPYLSIKKILESLAKIGWPQFTTVLEKIPSAIITRYQKDIGNLIAAELLEFDLDGHGQNALVNKIKTHPSLSELFDSNRISEKDLKLEFKKELDTYSSGQAMISDLSGSLITLAAGWMFFGDRTLGVLGIGDRIAHNVAHKRAAANFFLGSKLGTAFYKIVPPEPSRKDLYFATFFVGLLMTVLTLVVSTLSDPLRKQLGLHNKKLNLLMDSLEERLFLHLKKAVKQVEQSKSY